MKDSAQFFLLFAMIEIENNEIFEQMVWKCVKNVSSPQKRVNFLWNRKTIVV